ncbi:MAG: retron Ec67 family RNA-directed DNA polymerase/endonuclease [Acidobacteriota bacterium]|nr:retron Ec67 family RNA-directed DNA polymerase/endonuclease [Acidobacteriota bacterium]
MSRLAALKAASSLNALADLLDFKPKAVSYILYKIPSKSKYTTFEIPKRSGGQRTIKAPTEKLRNLQRKLADLLQDCQLEIETARHLNDRTAHGFKRGKSIVTNASQHRGRRWVLNLDLQDFFPSINFGRVRGFLIKNRDFALNAKVATVIAQIACHDNTLPQGSPCSPVISNLVAHVLDMRLVMLAGKFGCTYSRYADDLTFSTSKREFPAEIAKPLGAEAPETHLWVPGEALHGVLIRSGFAINAKKTRFMYRRSRQEVTGLTVNKKIGVRWRYRHDVRAMVHKLVTKGQFEVLSTVVKDGEPTLEKRPGTRPELHGMLGFIDSIDVFNAKLAAALRGAKRPYRSVSPKAPEQEFSSREAVYRQFLMYTTFYAPLKPVILCEGDTDNVYLRLAIRRLAADFPELAEITKQKIVVPKVRIYKHPKSSTTRLLDLGSGGYAPLGNFMSRYKKETAHFGPGLTEPVIVVYDNDSAGGQLRNKIKGEFKVASDGTEPFIHIFKNIYAVPIPFGPNAAPTEIEDLFDAATKATKLKGKSFCSEKNIDEDTQYSKSAFAKEVIAANAGKVDFNGFRPLLTNVAAAIRAHQKAVIEPSPKP